MSDDKGWTEHAEAHYNGEATVQQLFNALYTDLRMLQDGEWGPDYDSVEASIGTLAELAKRCGIAEMVDPRDDGGDWTEEEVLGICQELQLELELELEVGKEEIGPHDWRSGHEPE